MRFAMNLRSLVPAAGLHLDGAPVRGPARHRAGLQLPDARRLRRRRARPGPRKLSARLCDPLYLDILLRSIVDRRRRHRALPGPGFPAGALHLARGRRKNLYLQLVMLPFWTSFLVRTYAWLFLLRDTGLINTVLPALHLIAHPLPLLYNDGAVMLGLVYGFLPFMVLPIYATLERLDPALLEAAADLGARPWRPSARVIIPLAEARASSPARCWCSFPASART